MFSPEKIKGIAGADAICTTEAGGYSAKALLVDETGCNGQPCRRATITPYIGDGQIDWPLIPNTAYYNANLSLVVATTRPNGLFPSTLLAAITAPNCLNQASGLDNDWTTRVGMTCGNWRQSTGEIGVGHICSDTFSTKNFINGGSWSQCSVTIHLICVTRAINESSSLPPPPLLLPPLLASPSNASTEGGGQLPISAIPNPDQTLLSPPAIPASGNGSSFEVWKIGLIVGLVGAFCLIMVIIWAIFHPHITAQLRGVEKKSQTGTNTVS